MKSKNKVICILQKTYLHISEYVIAWYELALSKLHILPRS